jgi:DNA-directed RNA polymerase specialized sigma24 family protein
MAEPGDAEHLLALHKRLLQGDRVAPEELAELLLERISAEVARQFPHTDIHLIYDGVADALLNYCAKPVCFDAARGVPLDRYLAQAAWRNVANSVRGEKRRRVREEKWAENSDGKVVELHPSAGNPDQNEAHLQQQRLAELMQTLENPIDRKVFELQMNGERRTEEFAKVLGISHLSAAEQRSQVKRAKDRIGIRLKRKKGPRA